MAEKDKQTTIEEPTDVQTSEASPFGGVSTYAEQMDAALEKQGEYLVNSYEQQKAKAAQSYAQEQSAAYADYQNQINPYGAQAEQLAASGLSNSGYAESLKTQAYVAYQNRYSAARQSYQDSLVAFDNAFNEAKMQNDLARAELAAQTLQSQFEMIVSMIMNGTSSVMIDASNIMNQLKSSSGDPNAWKNVFNQYYASQVNVTTRDEAIELLESGGSSVKPMRRGEWKRSDKATDKTYEEYLNDFVKQQLYGTTGGGGTANVPTTYTTKEAAVSALEAAGIKYRPMAEWQWDMGHNAGSRGEDYSYGSYSEYLTAFVNKYL